LKSRLPPAFFFWARVILYLEADWRHCMPLLTPAELLGPLAAQND